MQLLFNVGGVEIKEEDAATLMSMTDQCEVAVDLSNYLSKDQLNAKKLFELSVEKGRPELAAVAARIAMSGPTKARKREKQKGFRRLHQVVAADVDINSCLDTLLTTRKLGSVGAAMILESLAKGKKMTLRDIAVEQVNTAWDKGVVEKSPIFRGFEDTGEEMVPVIAKAAKGVVTYHSSSIYNALREGLKYLVQQGMAVAVAKTSWGSDDKNLEGSEKLLRRTVYEVKLTDKGADLAGSWGDIDDFIFNFWNTRPV